MASESKLGPYQDSAFFRDGMAARPLPEGVVAWEGLREDDAFYRGLDGAGKPLADLPPNVPVTMDLLRRGQERFNIYCSVCHGASGYGDGMIVRRGYAQPPSYHIDRLRQAPAGHFFDVITHGFGRMPPYARQIDEGDRWAIVAYVRALQLSQHAASAGVPAGPAPRAPQPPGEPTAQPREGGARER